MNPVVAIVGRPNVGKSTLLNRLAGRQVAVVADVPGVTRDRVFAETTLAGRKVILVDTGGLDPNPRDELACNAVEQAKLAIDEADFVLLVCDAKDGLHPSDQTVADLLRKSQKSMLCVVNKSDPNATFRDPYSFHRLGVELVPVSALHGDGLSQLAELVAARLPPPREGDDLGMRFELKICLLGRPNVGKSSLANSLVGYDRQMVSSIPGTTRDAVDIEVHRKDLSALLVDTPGVRRKGRISQSLEHLSVISALRSMERSDVAIVVLDASEPFSDQDARLLGLVHDRGKGLVVAVNKSDLWKNKTQRLHYVDALKHGMRFVAYAPVEIVSAKCNTGIDDLLQVARHTLHSLNHRISTGDLNRFISEAIDRHEPPIIKGKRAKIYYITQSAVHPPTFVVWVNDPSRLPVSYQRYLDRIMRRRFRFSGAPLRWLFRTSGQDRRKPKKHARKRH